MKGKILLVFIFGLLCASIQAQVGYKKDSLQIKVYTEIDYKGDRPTKISVKKVFCDYCNDKQLQFLAQEAWSISYHNRFGYKDKIKNGKAKLAHYIRVHKEDFKQIQNED